MCDCKGKLSEECPKCGIRPELGYQCTNCKDTNPSNVGISTDENGDTYEWICYKCGIVFNGNPLAESYSPTVKRKRFRRGTGCSYRRKSHLVERLSAHHAVDPAIPATDAARIIEKFTALAIKPPFTKSDVSRVLQSINEDQPPGRENRYFSLRYLEKHKQIIKMVESDQDRLKYLNVEQTGQVGALFLAMSQIWDEWQKKENPSDRRFPERKHFPNYNQTFMRIFDLLGIKETDVDFNEFPLPKTDTSRKRVANYIDALEAEVKKRKIVD